MVLERDEEEEREEEAEESSEESLRFKLLIVEERRVVLGELGGEGVLTWWRACRLRRLIVGT